MDRTHRRPIQKPRPLERVDHNSRVRRRIIARPRRRLLLTIRHRELPGIWQPRRIATQGARRCRPRVIRLNLSEGRGKETALSARPISSRQGAGVGATRNRVASAWGQADAHCSLSSIDSWIPCSSVGVRWKVSVANSGGWDSQVIRLSLPQVRIRIFRSVSLWT